MTDADLAARVLVGTGCGVLLGIERARSHKIVGVRTLGLIGLAAALVVGSIARSGRDSGAVSRVTQGLVTGVGVLGAGVILRGVKHPHGLTTATAVWACCILGVVAGMGELLPAGVSACVMVALLALGDDIDRRIGGVADKADKQDPAP